MIGGCAKIVREKPFCHVGGVVDTSLVDPVASPETGIPTARGPCVADIEHFQERHALLSRRSGAQRLFGFAVSNPMGTAERAGLKQLGRDLAFFLGPLTRTKPRAPRQIR